MNGIFVEQTGSGDNRFWVVKDAKTGEVISIGNTVTAAVSNYETIIANEQMAQELGVSLDDMEI